MTLPIKRLFSVGNISTGFPLSPSRTNLRHPPPLYLASVICAKANFVRKAPDKTYFKFSWAERSLLQILPPLPVHGSVKAAIDKAFANERDCVSNKTLFTKLGDGLSLACYRSLLADSYSIQQLVPFTSFLLQKSRVK